MARVLFIFGLGGLQLVRALFIVGVVALHLRLTWLVYMLLRPCWILDLLSTLSLVFFSMFGWEIVYFWFGWLTFGGDIVYVACI